MIILSIFLAFLFRADFLSASHKVAVVKSKYDPIERVLAAMNIPYDLLSFHDLESGEVFSRYSVMFFPCGMEHTLEMNVNVLARGGSIQSVSLKEKLYEPDRELMASHIRGFIKSGGQAYFSGYSFDLLDRAFGIFRFHDNFPYMGLAGRVESTLAGDLEKFALKDTMALYMGHSGWITLESAHNTLTLASAAYATARGERQGPITCTGSFGRGFLLYTVYHDTVYSDFRRFNVYRVYGGALIDSLARIARFWDQDITGRIADALQPNENSRIYRIDLREGANSVYFAASKGSFQVDVVDSSFSLLESRDNRDRLKEFVIHADSDSQAYVRIYPSSSDRHALYAVVTARGIRVLPYFFTVLRVLGGLVLFAGLVFMVITFSRKGYSGRGRVL
jgi:hypothetical protein